MSAGTPTRMPDTTPPTLLARLRDPADRAAWERLVALYTPLLYGWGRRRGLSAADAADLVQDVLTVVVRQIPEFEYDPGRSFRAWLRKVAFHKFHDLRRDRVPLPLSPDELTRTAAATDVDACFEEAEYRRYLVRRALEAMQRDFAETTWKACLLAVTTPRTAASIGAELGLSEGAVYAAKFRVLRRLREELAGLDED